MHDWGTRETEVHGTATYLKRGFLLSNRHKLVTNLNLWGICGVCLGEKGLPGVTREITMTSMKAVASKQRLRTIRNWV